jgi:hypothetical protein
MYAVTALKLSPSNFTDKRVFSKYEPIGWYSNSISHVPAGEVLPGDIGLHEEVDFLALHPVS